MRCMLLELHCSMCCLHPQQLARFCCCSAALLVCCCCILESAACPICMVLCKGAKLSHTGFGVPGMLRSTCATRMRV